MRFLADKYVRAKDTFLRKAFTTANTAAGDSFGNREATENELRAVFGPIDLLMLGIGSIIGAGVFVLTGEATTEYAGPSIVLSYLFAAIAAILLGLSYVEFSVDMPLTGGAFNFIRHVQGEFFAWQGGVCLMMEYALGASAVSKGFSGYLASLCGLGSSAFIVDWWIFNLDGVAFALVTGLILLLVFSTKESSKFNVVVTFINLLLISFILIVAATKAKTDHFTPFMPNGLQDTFRATAVVFFAYIGFDGLANLSGEVKNPKRDLPLGVVGSISISSVIYVLMAAALVGLQPFEEIDAGAPYSEAFVYVDLRWVGRIVALGALTGIVSSLLTSLLGQSRVLIVLGRAKLLPEWLAKVDEKRATPKRALFVNWICSGSLALLFDIDILSRMVSMGTLFVLGLVSVAAVQRMYTPPATSLQGSRPVLIRLSLLIMGGVIEGAAFAAEAHPVVYVIGIGIVVAVTLSFYRMPVQYVPKHFVTPLKPITPCIAVLSAIHLMFSLGWEAHLLFVVCQVLGLIIYVCYGMHHTQEPVELTEVKQTQMQPNREKQQSGFLALHAERSDAPPEAL